MKILIDLFDVLAGIFYSIAFYLLQFLIPGTILYFIIRLSTKKQIYKELEKYNLKKNEQSEKNNEMK